MTTDKKTKPKKLKRTLMGGGILGLLILGAFLGRFLNLPGMNKPGVKDSEVVAKNKKKEEINPSSSPQPKVITSKPKETTAGSQLVSASEVIEVIIDDRKFFLKSKEDNQPLKEIELDMLMTLVKKTAGNEDGLRLRIFRTPTSKSSKEGELDQALNEAKIPDNAIYRVKDLLEK